METHRWRCPWEGLTPNRGSRRLAAAVAAVLALVLHASAFALTVSPLLRALPASLGLVARRANPPKVTPEPDWLPELAKAVKAVTGLEEDVKGFTAADRVTPIDRWLGLDKGILRKREEWDPYVDSSDDRSYVTVSLEKPLGIEFVENTDDEGGGVYVGEVRKGYNAYQSRLIEIGYQLIVVNDVPVHGLPFNAAIKPIIDCEGPVKLTFFAGDAEYFYGKLRPSSEWLADFMIRLKDSAVMSGTDPDDVDLADDDAVADDDDPDDGQ
eukprot:TRINITY_DN19327_c0_g1_i1.p1 TRINITY_DN19327_c0_g1~~TRINITY_DN19327_c0_g1_i1.p1  ORF type:complete len:268 (+),score=51.34 TRINITY_DN19327_c0_g1_i1:35-838(+)